MARRLAFALAAVVAGCGPSKPAPDVAITADQLPRIRIGQWEVATVANGAPQEVRRSCSASGRLPLPMTVRLYGCAAEPTMKRTGAGAIVIDLACAAPAADSIEHAVIRGDFGARFVSETRMTLIDHATNRPTVTDVRQTFRYLGPCPS